MLKGTRTASEQQTVSMELTIVIKLLLQQRNYICQETVFLKDLNKPVDNSGVLKQAFLMGNMLRHNDAFF